VRLLSICSGIKKADSAINPTSLDHEGDIPNYALKTFSRRDGTSSGKKYIFGVLWVGSGMSV